MAASICEVPGIRVGHAHDESAQTGCTVILPDAPAIAAVDVRGAAPGSRELEVLKPARLVRKIHGILLTGGSAFGLDAAGGVQRYLEENGIGFDTGVANVPIVPAAVIFDLHVGDPKIRPDQNMGYAACQAAHYNESRVGRVGAGIGATVGKLYGIEHKMWGGIGMAFRHQEGLKIGALVVVNALGDIIDPQNGQLVAGARDQNKKFLSAGRQWGAATSASFPDSGNTTLAVVATNAAFDKDDMMKLAQMAQDGLARAIVPAHTPYDGDMVFTLSTQTHESDLMVAGSMAAQLVSEAIITAVVASNQLTRS